MQSGSVAGLCAEIMDEDVVAVPFQILGEEQTGGFFSDVSVRFVREAEHGHRRAGFNHTLGLVQEVQVRLLVDPVRCLGQRCFKAGLPGRVRQEPVVSRKTRPAEAQAGAQILLPDPAVAADRIENGVDVRLWELVGDHP